MEKDSIELYNLTDLLIDIHPKTQHSHKDQVSSMSALARQLSKQTQQDYSQQS